MAQQEEYLQGAELWRRVCETYDAAQRSGAAASIDAQSEVLPDGGIDFVIRLATALRAKPKGDVRAAGSSAPAPGSSSTVQAAAAAPGQPAPPPPPRNPFLPPEPALTVGHLSATHTLLLNKFNVVPHHLLVVTREFRSQQEPLAAGDLAATLRVLRAMPRGGLAFYNCGEHSGRSQPHKHLQVVPLPFFEGQPERPPMQAAVDAACSSSAGGGGDGGEGGGSGPAVLALRQLPFRAYAVRLSSDSSLAPAQLEAAARQLVAACQAGMGNAPASYNLVLTQQLMLAVPRRREMSGPCAVNSLGFAGTLLVRSEEEAAHVRAAGPLAVLAEVGCPREGEQPAAAGGP